jgi:hypothetical protein
MELITKEIKHKCKTCGGTGIERVEIINVYGTYENQIKTLLGIAVEIYKNKQESVNGALQTAKFMMTECVKPCEKI